MLESRTNITVRYAETDMMGIVYHGSYVPWLEVGRTTLLKEYGFNYRELDAAGYRLPLTEIAVKYHRPAQYDDVITVHTRIPELPTVRMRIEYKLYRGEELIATAFTAHAFMDHEGRPTRPPAEMVAALRPHFD